jgi:hypothetical protein
VVRETRGVDFNWRTDNSRPSRFRSATILCECDLVPRNKVSHSLCPAAIWNLSDIDVIVQRISSGGLG